MHENPTLAFTAAMIALDGLRKHDFDERVTTDEHGLIVAQAVALRADCTRRRVGAVIVDTVGRVVGTGRNGAAPGHPGCLTAGACPRGQMSKTEVTPGSSYDTGAGSCIAIHAELNALLYSDADRRRGGTLYVTDAPCDGCARAVEGSGLARVVWAEVCPDSATWVIHERHLGAGVKVGGNYAHPTVLAAHL